MAKKRANGEGTVFQRPNGTWCAQVSFIDPGTGNRKRKTVSGKTKQEVLKKKRELEGLKDTGRLVDTKNITLEQWINTWIVDYMKGHLKPTTYSLYKTCINAYIIPQLGTIQLNKLQTADLQRFYNYLLEEGRIKPVKGDIAKTKTGLAPRSVHRIHQILDASLKQALIEHKILVNPCEFARPPKRKSRPIQPLTSEQVLLFLQAARDDWFYPVFMTELSTGLRRGELLGIKWGDVDLEAATVEIRRSLVVVNGRPELQEDVKTKTSRRNVYLPDEAVRVLRKYRIAQEEQLLTLGHRLNKSDLVFTWQDGRAIDPNYLRKHFSKLLKKAGLPHVRFHDLRHTYATLLLKAGEHPKVVQELLGHSNISTTLDLYSHVVPSMKARAASTINSFLIEEIKQSKTK